ncbi:MAG: hypothetical protein AAF627_19445 [Myxococcota bacterium]
MGKTATPSTLSPRVFSLGNGVYFEDLRTVAEQLNYSAGQHVMRYSYDRRPILFPGNEVVLRGLMWVPPWCPEIRCVVVTSGGGTFAPSVTLGANTRSFASNSTDEQAFLTSATSTGILTWTVNGNLTAGSGQLDRLYLQAGPVAATDLPDPE